MRSGVMPPDDDLDVAMARLVKPGAALLDQRRRDAAALDRRVEADAIQTIAQRLGDAQRLFGLVAERVNQHDARHVTAACAGQRPRAAWTVSPKMSTSEWGIVPVGARPASRAPAGVDAPTQPPTMAA